MDDTEHNIQILRDKHTKRASIKINLKTPWKLYAGASANNVDIVKPILEGDSKGLFPLNVNCSIRVYFKLITEDSQYTFAENHLPIAGAYNFRDLGGIRTISGKHIKWGRLFRGDDLSKLTKEDLIYLESIPITSIIDFRARNEAKRYPDRYPHTVKYSYPISITPVNLSKEGIQASLLNADIPGHMEEMYRLLVSDPNCIRAYRSFFNIIQNGLSAPIIFHCSAGKDRTGLAAALLLNALGVDMQTIMDDYLSSKIYLADKYSSYIMKYPRTQSLFTVKSSYLKSAFDTILNKYGSIHNFLEKELEVDLERLRSLYLE